MSFTDVGNNVLALKKFTLICCRGGKRIIENISCVWLHDWTVPKGDQIVCSLVSITFDSPQLDKQLKQNM